LFWHLLGSYIAVIAVFPRKTNSPDSLARSLSSLNSHLKAEEEEQREQNLVGENPGESAMREEHSPVRDGRRSGGLRSLIDPRFLSSFALNDGGSISGRRSSYLKLPPQGRIKLSVVKLNGSLFGTILLIQFPK